MFQFLTKKTEVMMNVICGHRVLYGGLCGSHGFAAWMTGKLEVHVPMMVLYAMLSWWG